jgi:hypothetical protein
VPLNLSSLNATTEAEVNACYAVINDSIVLNGEPNLAAAFERIYNDGSRQYYIYVDTVDPQYNIH